MISDVLKNMNLFIDGRTYAGKVDEFKSPTLKLKTEEFRGGGMDAPVEVELGMEKLEAEFSLSAYDANVLRLFGLAPGKQVALVFRGALTSESGVVTPIRIETRGQMRELDPGTWKPGEKSQLKGMLALRYYKLVHGTEELLEIDVERMIRRVGGVDQLAEVRSALGLGA